jgi:CRP-like cAMP-binding protein
VELRLPARAVVFAAGDPCDGLYQVRQGSVTLRRENVGEALERIRDIGPGELFGEFEVLDASPRLYAARALEPALLLRFPQAPLAELLAGQPLLQLRLRGLIIERRTSRLKTLLAPASRREPRILLGAPAHLTLPGGTVVQVRVEDLSLTGACLSQVPASWKPERHVVFALGTAEGPDLFEARAVVRWRDGGRVGVVFEDGGPGFRQRVSEAMRRLVPAPRR